MAPHAILGIAGLWTAWRPCETSAVSAVVLAALVLGLLPWALRRTSTGVVRAGTTAACLLAIFASTSALSGWDRSTAIEEVALAGLLWVLVWFGSRQAVTQRIISLFAMGISLLAVWAVWQAVWGFELAAASVPDMPHHMQQNAAERLESGRAFASLLLPGHLAALLATVLPLLVVRIRRSIGAIGWIIGCGLCVVGIVLTYSPVGIALAVAGCLLVVASGVRWRSLVIVGLLIAGLVLTFSFRSDLADLKPLQLRVANWKTASWAWSTSPVTGVGLGSYGQATQAVPFEVGNRPAHAHNLPLELIAELGIVGFVLTISGALALLVLMRRLWPQDRELAVAIAVVPLHNLVDFSIYTSGVAVPWAILVGWGLARASQPKSAADADLRPQSTGAHSPGLRLALITAAATAVALSVLHATSVVVEQSASLAPTAETRFLGARRAGQLAPWRLGPVWLSGSAAVVSGRDDLAAAGLERLSSSRWLRPRSASFADLASRLHLARGHIPHGLAEAWAAQSARPALDAHAAHYHAVLKRLRTTSNDP